MAYHMGGYLLASILLKIFLIEILAGLIQASDIKSRTYHELCQNIVLECNRLRSICHVYKIQMNCTAARVHRKVQTVDLFQLDD